MVSSTVKIAVSFLIDNLLTELVVKLNMSIRNAFSTYQSNEYVKKLLSFTVVEPATHFTC